jgi:hypothetical protein
MATAELDKRRKREKSGTAKRQFRPSNKDARPQKRSRYLRKTFREKIKNIYI